jgi:hypothetical protein
MARSFPELGEFRLIAVPLMTAWREAVGDRISWKSETERCVAQSRQAGAAAGRRRRALESLTAVAKFHGDPRAWHGKA